jgi:hypothetical protein
MQRRARARVDGGVVGRRGRRDRHRHVLLPQEAPGADGSPPGSPVSTA